MELPSRTVRGFVGIQLAIVAAGLHLVWGLPRLITYLGVGRIPDVRPLLFVLSAGIVAACVIAYHAGAPNRPIVAVLVIVMIAYLLGYVTWHLTGHPVFGPAGTIQTTHHPAGPVAQIVLHLQSDLFALSSAIVELAAVVLLGPMLMSAKSPT